MTKIKDDKWIAEQSMRGRILERILSKRSKFRKFLEQNQFSKEELDEIFIAFSVAASTDRKLAANAFTAALGLKTRTREMEQMYSEMERRYKIRMNYNIRERAFFETCLTRGWGSEKQDWAIASEIIAVLRAIDADPVSGAPYKRGGIDLAALAGDISKDKLNWRSIVETAKRNKDKNETVNRMLEGIARGAEFRIINVGRLVRAIQKGRQRAHIPYLKEIKKKNAQSK